MLHVEEVSGGEAGTPESGDCSATVMNTIKVYNVQTINAPELIFLGSSNLYDKNY